MYYDVPHVVITILSALQFYHFHQAGCMCVSISTHYSQYVHYCSWYRCGIDECGYVHTYVHACVYTYVVNIYQCKYMSSLLYKLHGCVYKHA